MDTLQYLSSDRVPWALEMVIEVHPGATVQSGHQTAILRIGQDEFRRADVIERDKKGSIVSTSSPFPLLIC